MSETRHYQAAHQHLVEMGFTSEECMRANELLRQHVYTDSTGQLFIVTTSNIEPYIGSIDKYNPKIHRIKRRTLW